MLGPSGRGAAVLVKKALPLGAMPATHAKARMGGVMRDTVRARRGVKTQLRALGFRNGGKHLGLIESVTLRGAAPD